jgi:hypothetical protein
MKEVEKFKLDISNSCTQKYFQSPQNKKIITMDSYKFNNLHEVTNLKNKIKYMPYGSLR